MAGLAPRTQTAGLSERAYDVIPNAEFRDIGADFRHYPRDLMAKHGRCREDRVRGEEQVSMAQPGRSHIYQNFAPNRRGDVHILEIETTTPCVKSSRRHA